MIPFAGSMSFAAILCGSRASKKYWDSLLNLETQDGKYGSAEERDKITVYHHCRVSERASGKLPLAWGHTILSWGTYLAVLLDEHKPLDPRIGSAEISMISDPEMKRINLEFLANPARLINTLREDERGCYRLLQLAHQYLAMPRYRPGRCAELLDAFRGLTSPDFWTLAGPDLKARMDRTRRRAGGSSRGGYGDRRRCGALPGTLSRRLSGSARQSDFQP